MATGISTSKGNPKRSMPLENACLHKPILEELSDVIRGGLQTNYKESSCTVVDCPNLADAPFFLAASGILFFSIWFLT